MGVSELQVACVVWCNERLNIFLLPHGSFLVKVLDMLEDGLTFYSLMGVSGDSTVAMYSAQLRDFLLPHGSFLTVDYTLNPVAPLLSTPSWEFHVHTIHGDLFLTNITFYSLMGVSAISSPPGLTLENFITFYSLMGVSS